MLVSGVQQSDSVIHTYSFSYLFSLWFITGDWIWFPVLYSRTLLSIHSKCNSLHLPYILEGKPLSAASFANIFSHAVGCLFIFFNGFLCCAKACKFD